MLDGDEGRRRRGVLEETMRGGGAPSSLPYSGTPIPFPFEEEVARLLALPTPPPSSLTPLSSPLPQIPPLPTSPTYA
ncbi:hypothetical protein Tco_0566532 [Tanacetum coccineum]